MGGAATLDMAFILALSAAFVLGVEHAFEPDHVVAVSTIVAQSRGILKSIATGSIWGLGHTVALLVAGVMVILLRVQFPIGIVSIFETLVGFMLVILGIWTIYNVRKRKMHFHFHSHDGKTHVHLHSHAETETHDHRHLPFSVGIVHGLAGSGALVILVMSTMTNVTDGLFFIAAFGGGLILAMSMISSALSLPLTFGGRLSALLGTLFPAVAGTISLLLGVLVVFRFV